MKKIFFLALLAVTVMANAQQEFPIGKKTGAQWKVILQQAGYGSSAGNFQDNLIYEYKESLSMPGRFGFVKCTECTAQQPMSSKKDGYVINNYNHINALDEFTTGKPYRPKPVINNIQAYDPQMAQIEAGNLQARLQANDIALESLKVTKDANEVAKKQGRWNTAMNVLGTLGQLGLGISNQVGLYKGKYQSNLVSNNYSSYYNNRPTEWNTNPGGTFPLPNDGNPIGGGTIYNGGVTNGTVWNTGTSTIPTNNNSNWYNGTTVTTVLPGDGQPVWIP